MDIIYIFFLLILVIFILIYYVCSSLKGDILTYFALFFIRVSFF